MNIYLKYYNLLLLFIPVIFRDIFFLCYYFQSSQKGQQRLNTFVVSASVINAISPIKDLDEDVKVTLHHLTPNTVGCALLLKHDYLLKDLRVTVAAHLMNE